RSSGRRGRRRRSWPPYRQGELSWLRALAIAPVVREETAAAWIARAQAVTVRRLVDEVEWVVERRAAGVSAAASEPPPPGTRLVLPERQMRAHEECPPVDAEIVFFAPAFARGPGRARVAPSRSRGWPLAP